MSVHFETWASDESTEGLGDGLRRRGVGEVERLGDGRRDLDLCNKKNKTTRVNTGVRRLNAYTTNMKEANRNARRVPT